MTKSIREMQEDMKLIDLVIEIVDARIPYSSQNPDIKKLSNGKARMILLGKSDLADEKENEIWMKYFKEQGLNPFLMDARKNGSLKAINPYIREACKEKIERWKRKGIMNRPIRAMVCGIPNVGKSTFINSFSGSSSAKTGNKPGVTRGKQWIRMSRSVQLLDTPGLLWPKFEDQEIGKKIALIGSIKDDILNTEELSLELITRLTARYPGMISQRYNVDESLAPLELLKEVARNRGCLKKGAEPDIEKAAAIMIDEFRTGKIGRITLETPGEHAL